LQLKVSIDLRRLCPKPVLLLQLKLGVVFDIGLDLRVLPHCGAKLGLHLSIRLGDDLLSLPPGLKPVKVL